MWESNAEQMQALSLRYPEGKIPIPRTAEPVAHLGLGRYVIGQSVSGLGIEKYLQPKDLLRALNSVLRVDVKKGDEELLFGEKKKKEEPVHYEIGVVSFLSKKGGRELRQQTRKLLPPESGWRLGGVGACLGFIRVCSELSLRGEVVALGHDLGLCRDRILVVRNCLRSMPTGRVLDSRRLATLKPIAIFDPQPVHIIVTRQISP